MRDIVKKVQEWSTARGLSMCDGFSSQIPKLKEELLDELIPALEREDWHEIIDGIGDIQVVLIVMCQQLAIDYDTCLEIAYNVIKNRKGKLVNGIFVKESEG